MHIDEKWSKDDDLDYRLSTKIQFVIEKGRNLNGVTILPPKKWY